MYITELLNVYYNYMNIIDNIKKNDKILTQRYRHMRIISGRARGTKLYTLEGDSTRPTLDRVKESIFNIIQRDIKDSIFLDLFAGSGAIGLEAASRGAKKAILCDKSKEAMQIIKKNILKTHLENVVETYLLDFRALLNDKLNEKLDIVYIDPPYKSDFAIQAVNIILENNLITKDSLILIETDRKEEVEEKLKKVDVRIIDERKYGRAEIFFLKMNIS